MQRLDGWLAWVEDATMVVAMALATVLITLQVVLRYGFDSSITWAEELTRYAIVWMSFVGAGMGVRAAAHITVDLVPAMLGDEMRARLRQAMAVVGIAFGAALGWLGAELVLRAWEGGQVSPALEWPMYLVYLAIPLGATLLTLRFAQLLWQVPQPEPAAAGGEIEVRKGGM